MEKISNKKWIICLGLITLLGMTSLACNLFATSDQPTAAVVEEPVIAEETEEEFPQWSPEVVFQLDHEDTVQSVAYSHNGSLLATGFFIQSNIWNATDGSLANEIEMNHSVDDMTFLPGDQIIAAGVSVGGVSLHNVSNGELVQNFHSGNNNFLSVSPDGTLIATGNRSGIIWVWQVEDGKLVIELDPSNFHDGYSEWLTSLAFSPDGSTLASGFWDGTVFIWDIENNELIHTLSPEFDSGSAWDLAFSPDGQHLAVGGARYEFTDVIAIWDVSAGTLLRYLEEFTRGGTRNTPVDFSSDGSLLAAGAVDGIYLWSMPDFEFLDVLPIEEAEENDWVTDLEFSPDSQRLLASYWGGYAQLWQVKP